ncbi:chloramphenicol phosphotransferase CPT family protein [Parasphingorhabdus halotolerans]|uniref:Chloramphenicol phosphotransferase n=1 Tax=Parasphingorhabdus halotolerans TaxID=2725558 RepID=A0A6H2DMK8_9SPHN|nr:chloramphenicol phosphotransferase [Parasphingorhabdus halotolerans]QJB69367.1 chloramphenicol phosphotransferase [Parasphingorhabdus halotolerans]
MSAKVITVNGTSSVGKSSTIKALQSITSDPFMHVKFDAFLEMLPTSMFGHPDGIDFETVQIDGKPSVTIEMGKNMLNALRGMRSAVAALASEGNNQIVDDVMLGATNQQHYRKVMSDAEIQFVGLFAPLEILEQREKSRGDRQIGLARWQYDRVHAGVDYDLEIDTSAFSPNECARKIAEYFGLG